MYRLHFLLPRCLCLCSQSACPSSGWRVVGAGAAGLCVARHILARPAVYAPPVVYELTENVGGTWCYDERVGCYDNGQPIPSSMYKNLR